jgi:hypothetical protein
LEEADADGQRNLSIGDCSNEIDEKKRTASNQ